MSEEPTGDCPCGGDVCPSAFGWVWKSSDLGNSMHRGKMWAEVCPSWDTDERVWNGESGEFVAAEPPTPPGMDEENFHRFRQKVWDNVEQSATDLAMNMKHESRRGADDGTVLE